MQERFTPHTIRQRKKDGRVKTRRIMVPSEETKARHQGMLKLLYGLEIPMPYATAAQPGRQLLDNVRPHKNSNYFYMVDLRDAFSRVRVDELVARASSPLVPKRHEPMVHDFIREWATHPDVPGLPLGAPASPFLFNLYCLPMDRSLGTYCDDEGITYTRYLDDLTFSTPDVLGRRRRRKLTERIQSLPGMEINHAKSRLHSLGRGAVTITGVSLYPSRRLAPSPALLDIARQSFADGGRMAERGQLITDEEIGQMHGYHGAITQMTEGRTTPTLLELDEEYRRAVGSLGLL